MAPLPPSPGSHAHDPLKLQDAHGQGGENFVTCEPTASKRLFVFVLLSMIGDRLLHLVNTVAADDEEITSVSNKSCVSITDWLIICQPFTPSWREIAVKVAHI